MTKTEAKKEVARLRRAGILATIELDWMKPNHTWTYKVVEVGTAKGQTAPREWS